MRVAVRAVRRARGVRTCSTEGPGRTCQLSVGAPRLGLAHLAEGAQQGEVGLIRFGLALGLGLGLGLGARAWSAG